MKILLTSDLHRGHSPSTGRIHDKFGRKINKESWDVLIVAGDHASTQQDEYRRAMKAYRTWAGDRQVIIVDGNHDFWNSDGIRQPHLLPDAVEALHRNWAQAYDIHRLEDGALITGDFTFVGWMGWYATPPRTNDWYWIGDTHPEGFPMNQWFKAKEAREFTCALEDIDLASKEGQTVIAVTHFPITHADNSHAASCSHYELVKRAGADFLLHGHFHGPAYHKEDGYLTTMKAAIDYDKPGYVIIDLFKGTP